MSKTSAVFHVNLFYNIGDNAFFHVNVGLKWRIILAAKTASEKNSFLKITETYFHAILIRKQNFIPALAVVYSEMNMYILCVLNQNLSDQVDIAIDFLK